MTTMYWLAFALRGCCGGYGPGRHRSDAHGRGGFSLAHSRRQRYRFSGDWLDLART
jgi:hypothetical protein